MKTGLIIHVHNQTLGVRNLAVRSGDNQNNMKNGFGASFSIN